MWRLVVAAISVLAATNDVPTTPAPILIPSRQLTDVVVCTEYTTAANPRVASRSCVDAAAVRAFILRNAAPDPCE